MVIELTYYFCNLIDKKTEIKNENAKNTHYQEKVNDVVGNNISKLDNDIEQINQKRLPEDEHFKELSEKLQRLEQKSDLDREELLKDILSYMNTIKLKCETLEDDVRTMTLGTYNHTNFDDKSSANEMLSNKNSNQVIIDIKERVLKLEMLTSDYAKRFIEPEAALRVQKLSNQFILIDDKFDSLLFLLKHYKLLPNLLLKNSVQTFKDALSKANFKYS